MSREDSAVLVASPSDVARTEPNGSSRPADSASAAAESAGRHQPSFVDLFAGCGGLSLGLMNAGLRGVLAVERDRYAFETLQTNLIDSAEQPAYTWPDWFPKEPCDIADFGSKYQDQLKGLRGTIDLLAGGPPCQGFSFAGKRDKGDPRNEMFQLYVDVIKALEPAFLLLENVRGISIGFGKKAASRSKRSGRRPVPFSDRIKKLLNGAGYHVYPGLVKAADFGVPQYRPRWIVFGINKRLLRKSNQVDPFEVLMAVRRGLLAVKGLPLDRPVTVEDAISDLISTDQQLVDCDDSRGFKQVSYGAPKTHFQRLLHGSMNGSAPNSMRLANHRDHVRARFEQILETCRHGVLLSPSDRERFNLKKQCIVPLAGDKPAHTLTTLPDDFLHYSEPRILTVREYARLQSFPDWFRFEGKYTTGSDQRVRECPRYTQVANAVPPLLAEALGSTFIRLADTVGLTSPSTRT